MVITRRIAPCDAPGLDRRIPDAKGGAVHVHSLVQASSPIRTPGHDPDILQGAAFEHPAEVRLTLDAVRGHVPSPIAVDIQLPTPDQPSVGVRSFRDFGCSTVSGQYSEQSSRFCNFNCRHREPLSRTVFSFVWEGTGQHVQKGA
jgi:hypothetical protein